MNRLILAATFALILVGCGTITPGGAGQPAQTALRSLPVTPADVLGVVPRSFAAVSRERDWGRPVAMHMDSEENTLLLVGHPGPASDSLTVVAFRSSSDSPSVSEANLPVLRALIQRVVPDPEAARWFDEWSSSCCTQPNEVEQTFGFVRTALSFSPLLGVGVSFSIAGDELRH